MKKAALYSLFKDVFWIILLFRNITSLKVTKIIRIRYQSIIITLFWFIFYILPENHRKLIKRWLCFLFFRKKISKEGLHTKEKGFIYVE